MPSVSHLLRLPRPFPSRYGQPVILRVDPAIFRRRYFTACLDCGFCFDACCEHGVDVDEWHYRRIMQQADGLEAFTGIPRGAWFEERVEEDAQVPGGATRRTAVWDGWCVFLDREGRGCLLHRFAVRTGLDHRDLKSLVDCLFPLSFYDGVLCAAEDVADGTLVCLDTGPTLYRGQREELRYYFGDDFVQALDEMEALSRRSST